MAKIEMITGHDDAVNLLSKLKLIVSLRYRHGFLCARYNVNKRTLLKYARRLDGVK